MLEISKDPKNPEYDEVREWLGLEEDDIFDSMFFDSSEVIFNDPKKELKFIENN
jgi:hypothetical protein